MGGYTRCVIWDFRVGGVGEEPEIIVVAMGIESDLLLIGASGIHMCVRVKVAALLCQTDIYKDHTLVFK